MTAAVRTMLANGLRSAALSPRRCSAFGAMTPAAAADGKIAVVAAENMYGDIAAQIGGDKRRGRRA